MRCPSCDCIVDDAAPGCWRCKAQWGTQPPGPVDDGAQEPHLVSALDRDADAPKSGSRVATLVVSGLMALVLAIGLVVTYNTLIVDSKSDLEQANEVGARLSDFRNGWDRQLDGGADISAIVSGNFVQLMKHASGDGCGLTEDYLRSSETFAITPKVSAKVVFQYEDRSASASTEVAMFRTALEARRAHATFDDECVQTGLVAAVSAALQNQLPGSTVTVGETAPLDLPSVAVVGRELLLSVRAGAEETVYDVAFAVLQHGRTAELVVTLSSSDALPRDRRDALLRSLADRLAAA